MKIAIYGPGGFGRELVNIAREALGAGGEPDDLVFVSDSPDEIGRIICGVKVIPPQELDCPAVIAIADGAVRRRLAGGITAASLVSPLHRRGPDVDVGEGAIFCDFTMVTASSRIGRHFHGNYYSYVAHDCVVGDFVTFGPRAGCSGNVHIEDDVYVGAGALIRQGVPGRPLRIGRGAIIGMGAVVTKDVSAGTTVIGNPARPLELK